MLQIYNTLSRSKQVFKPIIPGKVKVYVCGMTVYDFCHIGHARVMIVFDMVVRWLRASGYEVLYVRNITDIDDKIIHRAVENGEPIAALTQRFIDAMHADSDELGLIHPDQEPRATDFIAQMPRKGAICEPLSMAAPRASLLAIQPRMPWVFRSGAISSIVSKKPATGEPG